MFGFGSQFNQPQQNTFGQAGAAFGQPAANTFGQPAANTFGQPATNTFGQPATNTFGQPATNTFGQPAANTFGQPAANTFGQPAANTFGQPAANTFGQQQQQFGGSNFADNNGTGNPTWAATSDKESATSLTCFFQSISAMPAYKKWSLEELRLHDYQNNKKAPKQFGTTSFAQNSFSKPGFGAATTTPAFGSAAPAFGSSAAAPAFGANTAPTFGSNATPAFGANATPAFGASAAPTFGSSTAAPAFGSAPSFGSSTTAPAFGAAVATPAFGAATTTPAFGSSFGQPAKPSLFGQPASTQPTTTFGQPAQTSTFGQPAQTSTFGQPAQTSTFGQPSTTNTGLFGQPSQPSTFGQPGTTGTGLFGQPAAQTAAPSLFGQPAATTLNSSGLFGATPAPKTTFGAAPTTGLFGSTAAQPAATGTGLFGQSQTTSTGLFGSKPAVTGTFGAPAGGLFTQPKPATPAQQQFPQNQAGGLFGKPVQNVLHASLNTNPYGINPVLQKQQAPAVEKPALLTPVQDSKKPQMPNFKVTPRSSSKMKLRGVAPVNQGPSILEVTQSRLMSPSNLNPSASPRNPVSLGLDSRFTPRKSVKRLTIDEAADLVQPTPGIQKTPKSTLTFDPLLEESAAQLITPARQNGVKSPLSKSPTKSPLKSSPTKSEYVLQPPLKDLLLMSDQDLRHVENFCISLHGVGQVSFLDPVDLLYSSPTGTRAGIKSIAGKIVILENKLCTVYPDEDLKPPPGFGLNVPAEISLHRCWPIDKATREYITDEKDVRHDRHMRKLAEMSDTTFIGFNQMTGTWKFRVEHFSKYGLVDDDEDDGEELPIVPKNVDDLEGFDSAINESSIYIQDSFQQGPIKAKTLSYAAIKDDIPNDKYHLEEEEKEEYEYYQQDVSSEELEIIEEEEEVDVHEEISEEDIYYEEEETEELDIEDEEEEELVFDGEEEEAEDEDEYVPEPEPLRPSISELALAQKVQAMKQALFPHASPITQPIPSSPMFTVPKRNAEAAGDEQSSRASFSPQPNDAIMNMMPSPTKYRKIVAEPILLDKLVPFEKSVFYDKRNCVDAAIYMGRSFRVGWAGNSFTAVSKTIGKVSIIKVATIDDDQRAHEKTVCKAFFDRMIENSAIDGSRNGPKAVINDTLGFSFFTLANQTQSERDVVSLAAALWDPIAFDTSGEEIEASKMDAIKGGLKRRALANWFKKVVLPTVEIDLSTAEDGFQKIFYYLSGNYLAKAVLEAIKTRNLRLATILSQVGGPSSQIAVNFAKDSEPLSWGFTSCVPGRGMTDPDTLANIAGQIEIFNGMPIDTYFKYTWSIISGSTGDWEPEMLKLLDWKRVLGLLFWYANGGDLSIERALEKYQPYAEAGYPPLASYDKCHSQDLCFSLLNLSIGKIDVEKVLDPLGHCEKMLNVRLTWFLGKMFQLKGIGENLKADAMDVWTSQAIFQLQDLGLWEYGVYLASFIANEIDRANAIKLIISKQTKIEPEMVDFLVSKLKVPLKWINESQALYSKYKKDQESEIRFLLDAEEFQAAHSILLNIMPQFVITNTVAKLLPILKRFPSTITGYNYGAGLLIDYIENEAPSSVVLPKLIAARNNWKQDRLCTICLQLITTKLTKKNENMLSECRLQQIRDAVPEIF